MAEIASLLTGFVLTLLLQASVLLGAVWLAERGGALRHPRWAEVAWRGALFGALLSAAATTALSSSSPSSRTTPPVATATSPAGPAESMLALRVAATLESGEALEAGQAHQLRAARGLRLARTGRAMRNAVTALAPAPPASFAVNAGPLALPPAAIGAIGALWLAAALAWLGVTALRAWGVRRLLHRAWRAPPAAPPQQQQAARLARELRLASPRLHLDALLASPVALPRRTVLLPHWSVQLPERASRALLAHELAHLARCDPAWRIAQHLALAPLLLHPLAWLALRRLEALAEVQADAAAARLLGDGRPLAECLALCLAQRVAPVAVAPRFALAMAERPGAVVDRVQRLLDEDPMNFPPPSPRRTRVALVLGLIAALSLPTIAVTALADGAQRQSISVQIDDDGRESADITIRRGDYALEVELQGPIVFAPDESDVVSLGDEAELSIAETRDGVARSIEFRPDGKGVARDYWVEGAAHAFDADARAWLALVLPEIFRSTALDAEARAERILARGGVDALLLEIEQIRADHGRSRYLGLLFTLARPDPRQQARALELARAIESDYELRQALSRALASQRLERAQQHQLLGLAQELDSDYERAELLIASAGHVSLDAAAYALWAKALDGIGSDYEQRRVLEALLARESDQAVAVRLAFDAARGLGSDYEKRQLLAAGLASAGGEATLRRQYVSVAATLGSDYERKEALLTLLRGGTVDAELALATLAAIAPMGSDYECKEALIALAKVMPVEAAVVARYRAVARRLGAYERGEVEQALDRLALAR